MTNLNRAAVHLGAVGSLAGLCKAGLFAALTLAGRNRRATLAQVLRVPGHFCWAGLLERKLAGSTRLLIREDGLDLWDTPLGKFWAPPGGLVQVLAEQAQSWYGAGAAGVRAGDVVLDCGAHVGTFTRTALQAGAARVLAIEPAAPQQECLRRNFALEIGRGRVILVSEGVWEHSGILSFHQGADRLQDHFEAETAGPLKLPVLTIDELVERAALPRVDFIKMDLEGAERRALAGARRTLARWKPRLALASYHLPDDNDILPALVREANPDYRVECGLCMKRGWRLEPVVLLCR